MFFRAPKDIVYTIVHLNVSCSSKFGSCTLAWHCLLRFTTVYLRVWLQFVLGFSVQIISVCSDVSRPFWRTVYRFGRPNFGAKKTLFRFSFFSCISTKNTLKQSMISQHIKLFGNDLEDKKCRQKRKTMRQKELKRKKEFNALYRSRKYSIFYFWFWFWTFWFRWRK